MTLKCGEFDKYGRLLAEIRCDGDSCTVNKWLVDKDYAFEYHGGAKNHGSHILNQENNAENIE